MRDAGAKVPLGNTSSSSSQRGMHSGLGGGGTRHQADAEMALNQAWDLYYTVFRKVLYCYYYRCTHYCCRSYQCYDAWLHKLALYGALARMCECVIESTACWRMSV
jgi:hypothetical protein